MSLLPNHALVVTTVVHQTHGHATPTNHALVTAVTPQTMSLLPNHALVTTVTTVTSA